MRKIQVPELADILVSELLGSFGDNEASPECLDGAMRFLKRTFISHVLFYISQFETADGISIPSSYTAYLAPISSPKLHNELLLSTNKASPETPYVVMLQAVNMLSGDGGGLRGACGSRIQECWTFNHPRRDAVLNDQGRKVYIAHLKELTQRTRVADNQRTQYPICQNDIPHSACWSATWLGWLL
jgi:protein arginine N-methyltransferase 5